MYYCRQELYLARKKKKKISRRKECEISALLLISYREYEDAETLVKSIGNSDTWWRQ